MRGMGKSLFKPGDMVAICDDDNGKIITIVTVKTVSGTQWFRDTRGRWVKPQPGVCHRLATNEEVEKKGLAGHAGHKLFHEWEVLSLATLEAICALLDAATPDTGEKEREDNGNE